LHRARKGSATNHEIICRTHIRHENPLLHIKQLEDDSLSSAPDLNTQIAVLNKINAANILLVRTMQDTNKLLASLLEQQLVTTERNRTSSVGGINTELYRQQHFNDVMSFTSSVPTQLQTPTGK
jgi:hypothetical protein